MFIIVIEISVSNIVVYQKVLQVCANRNNIQMATKVFEDYKNLQTPMSETMFTEMLALLIRNCLYVQKKELDWRAEAPTPKALSRSSGGSSSDSPLQDMTNLLNEYYESYRKLKVEKQWRTGESIYIDMLKYHKYVTSLIPRRYASVAVIIIVVVNCSC